MTRYFYQDLRDISHAFEKVTKKQQNSNFRNGALVVKMSALQTFEKSVTKQRKISIILAQAINFWAQFGYTYATNGRTTYGHCVHHNCTHNYTTTSLLTNHKPCHLHLQT